MYICVSVHISTSIERIRVNHDISVSIERIRELINQVNQELES